jgi:transcriptional regulator of met regulon
MSKNEKAYLVININEIETLLKAAKHRQKKAEVREKSFCIVLRDLEIITDTRGNRQVCSWSVNTAIIKNLKP